MTSPVRVGLDVLVQDRPELVRGRRVGLLCHPASVSSRGLDHAADLLALAGADLRCLLGPEHGIRGAAQDMVGVGEQLDPRLGIPVHSLYGSGEDSLRPGARQLSGLDLLVLDLQDVGSRYYTYIWTLVLSMQACAEAGVGVLVLDRPNPLGGQLLEGPGIAPGYTSFVGLHDVPVRHGLTAGEVARLARAELGLERLELQLVPMEGWRREALFDETGLPWVLPSPNMPTLDTALVYPGCCLLEGTNLSEGRGTTRPFEILGAPWVDGQQLASTLERQQLPGVVFRPLVFSPTFHKHAGQACGGIQIHVTGRREFRPLRTGVALLWALGQLWPDQLQWRREVYEFVSDRPAIDLLAGGSWLRQGIDDGASLQALTAGWQQQQLDFARRRQPHLIY